MIIDILKPMVILIIVFFTLLVVGFGIFVACLVLYGEIKYRLIRKDKTISNISKRTKAVGLRLPVEVYAIVERRAKKRGMTVGAYIRWLACYDGLRKR